MAGSGTAYVDDDLYVAAAHQVAVDAEDVEDPAGQRLGECREALECGAAGVDRRRRRVQGFAEHRSVQCLIDEVDGGPVVRLMLMIAGG